MKRKRFVPAFPLCVKLPFSVRQRVFRFTVRQRWIRKRIVAGSVRRYDTRAGAATDGACGRIVFGLTARLLAIGI